MSCVSALRSTTMCLVQILQGSAALLGQMFERGDALLLHELDGPRQLILQGLDGGFPLGGDQFRRRFRHAHGAFDSRGQAVNGRDGLFGGFHCPLGEGQCLRHREFRHEFRLEQLGLPAPLPEELVAVNLEPTVEIIHGGGDLGDASPVDTEPEPSRSSARLSVVSRSAIE